MNVTWLLVLWSLVPQIFAATNELPNCLRQFIYEAFQRDTKTVYLIGLDKLNSFEAYLSLPYPKVILNQNASFRSIDAASFVVLYLDFSNPETLYHSLAIVLTNVLERTDKRKSSSKAKFVILGDDALIRTSSLNVVRDIGLIFVYYGMQYWCIAAHSGGYHMYYGIILANAFVFHTEACDIDKIFGMQRPLPLKNVLLNAHFVNSFPYSFRLTNKKLGGLDVIIFQDVFDHLGANIEVKSLGGRGLDQLQIKQQIEANLDNAQIDFLLSRKLLKHGDFEGVFIPENAYIGLVVPYTSKVDLTSSLVRPFDNAVWIALGMAVGLFQLSRLLLKTNNVIGRILASLQGNENWQTFATIAIEWSSFILIECYLAQITSFFMDFRFLPEPQTLDEFFVANIPIRLPADQKHLLDRMEASLAAAIREKAVPAEACEEFSANCAHMDRYVRAMYRIMHYQPIDPVTNRKISYVLKEPLFSEPWSYVFARGSSLTDLFAVYLARLYEAGIPQWYTGTMNMYIETPLQRHDESLRLEHLASIWMFIVASWVVAALVFIMELVVGRFTH